MRTSRRPSVRRPVLRVPVLLLALLLGAVLAQKQLDPGPGLSGPTVPPPPFSLQVLAGPDLHGPALGGGVTADEMRDLRELARIRTLPAPVHADAGAEALTESSGGGGAPRTYAEAVGTDEPGLVRTVLLVVPDGRGQGGWPSPRGGGEVPFR